MTHLPARTPDKRGKKWNCAYWMSCKHNILYIFLYLSNRTFVERCDLLC